MQHEKMIADKTYKGWQKIVLDDPTHRDETGRVEANDKSAREGYKALFEKEVPDEIAGFECHDKDKMKELWPVGPTTADEVLDRFLHCKNREDATESSPLGDGAEKDVKNARIKQYADGRNITTGETTSKISPYLASGQISIRQCFNRAQKLKSGYNMDVTRESGVGMWSQEVVWKDFYQNVGRRSSGNNDHLANITIGTLCEPSRIHGSSLP